MTDGDSQRGTSLAEVLVAMLLLAFGLLATAPMFVSSLKQGEVGVDLNRVGAAASARMEVLRASPFHLIPAGGSLTSNVTDYFDASDPDVLVRWEIVDGGGPTGTRSITVRAEALRQVVGNPKAVVLYTLRSR